jgi:hypothetical protein
MVPSTVDIASERIAGLVSREHEKQEVALVNSKSDLAIRYLCLGYRFNIDGGIMSDPMQGRGSAKSHKLPTYLVGS